MAMKSQGSQLYIIDPADDSILNIACAISLDGMSATRDEIEITCLEDGARRYLAGLANPTNLNVTLNFDASSAAHERILELWEAGTTFHAIIGLSDGTAAPTADTDGLPVLPTTRSYFSMLNSYFQDVPISIPLNGVVTANVSIKLSDFYTFSKKA